MAAMYYSVYWEVVPSGNLFPISFMKLGIIAEVLFFSLGLGHKIRLVTHERDRVQQSYIEQLKRNEKLNQETKKGLEEQVAERTAQIIKKTKELEIEKEAKIKAQYEQKLMRSEMHSLRLQMNPHFIFNSLNSIRHLILKKDWQQASSYVTGFSKLLRLILQNSKKSTVPLADDLAALDIYLSFEQKRFENKFEYTLNLDAQIDSRSVQIQPLLIQPFVENAIWHGLMHKTTKGKLIINVSKEEDYLIFTIEDNGIGRDASAKINSAKTQHKSLGMSITRERVEIMNKLNQTNGGFKTIDLKDASGKALGTRVVIRLKAH
jgi:sensor histidine kinase YesM